MVLAKADDDLGDPDKVLEHLTGNLVEIPGLS